MSSLPTPVDRWTVPTRHVGRAALIYERLDSTNRLALEIAKNRSADGMVVLAREQTAGRGQYGRAWSAPPGSSVLMSVLLFPPAELRRPAVLTAWAAISVCETVQQLIGQPAKIKWPNDVLCQDRKLCGILIEQRSSTGQDRASVIGIGLNVNQRAEWFTQAGLPLATSLAGLTGKPHDVDAVARNLLQRLDEEYGRLRDGDVAGLESRWIARLGVLGKTVRVETHAGSIHEGCLRQLSFSRLQLALNADHQLHFAPEHVKQLAAQGAASLRRAGKALQSQ